MNIDFLSVSTLQRLYYVYLTQFPRYFICIFRHDVIILWSFTHEWSEVRNLPMLIYRVHGISRYSSCSTVLHFTYSVRLGSMSLSLSRFPSYSVKRRISSAVRNLQILFQLHPGKRSFSPVPAGKTVWRYLENSSNRGAPCCPCKLLPSRQFVWKEHRGVKEGKMEKMRDWERESKRELHRRYSLEAGQVQKSPWRGSLLCNYHVLHN